MIEKFSDDTLSAFLDGELPEDDMRRIAQLLEKDKELQRRLDALQGADALWRDAINALSAGEIPQNVMARFDVETQNPANDNFSFSKVIWPAAACFAFALGLAARSFLPFDGDHGQGLYMAGKVHAGHALYAALEAGPSAKSILIDQDGSVSAQPILSFASQDGRYCREFIVSSPNAATRNIACRGQEESWDILISTQTRPINQNEYHTVSAETEQSVARLVDEIIDGDPFDPELEMTLIESGWKNKNY